MLVLVLVGGSVVFGDSFASGQNLGNIALDSSYLLLIATGMTFVILSGGIDLSVGSLLALAGVLTAYGAQWGTVAAVALPLLVCAAFGLVNGLLIGRARIAPFIVTLAALLFARGLAFAVAERGQQGLHHPGRPDADPARPGALARRHAPVLVRAGARSRSGVVVLNRTRFGQAVFAVGDSQEAAELMGLPVARVRVLVYVLSAAARRRRRRAGRRADLVRPADHRRGPGTGGDRRGGHRRHAAVRRRRLARAGRSPACCCSR